MAPKPSSRKKAVPSNLRKRVPKPGEKKPSSEVASEATTTPTTAGKPRPKPKPQPKGVKNHGAKAKEAPEPKEPQAGGASPEAPKAPATRGGGPQRRPRPNAKQPTEKEVEAPKVTEEPVPDPELDTTDVEDTDKVPTSTGQVSYDHMKSMSPKERDDLSKQLNRGIQNFVQIIKRDELPKKMVMRKNEAEMRNVLGPKPKGARHYYCPYCVDYMKFVAHSYTGYDRCQGCGMTSKDFYISADNDLFGKAK